MVHSGICAAGLLVSLYFPGCSQVYVMRWISAVDSETYNCPYVYKSYMVLKIYLVGPLLFGMRTRSSVADDMLRLNFVDHHTWVKILVAMTGTSKQVLYHLTHWGWVPSHYLSLKKKKKKGEAWQRLWILEFQVSLRYCSSEPIWAYAIILSIGPLGTHLSEILIEILSHTFSFKKMHLKMSSTKLAAILSQPQCVSQVIATYRKISDIRRTKSPNVIVSRLVLQLSVPNSTKPGVMSRMKM